MIQCVVFDFDGTLVHSNSIKRDGFLAISDRYQGGRATMEEIISKTPGDRFCILNRFVGEVNEKVEVAVLVDQYSQWCEKRILKCPERQGVSELLQRLRQEGVLIYLNSATPLDSLRVIINRRYETGTFNGIYGGYGCKVSNLNSIMLSEGLMPKNMIMVGDGIDDKQAALEFGCCFVGVSGGSLEKSLNHDSLFDDFNNLWSILVSTQIGRF